MTSTWVDVLAGGAKYAVLLGDCLDMLRTLPDGCAQTCVTSPPYWGLRDYGHAGQIGLEKTPEEYVARLVAVFREVRRVLADDGTLWLNLGDSYAGSTTLGRNDAGRNLTGGGGNKLGSGNPGRQGQHSRNCDVKPKDLVGIPWRVAFALQADGWWLRSDIIWAKPNPMPESVTDRPTKAHEYVFLLAKSERYFYDAEAIKERSVGEWNSARSTLAANGVKNVALNKSGQRRTAGADTHHDDEWKNGRNKRSVWTVATEPFDGAHFAVMPPSLVKPCVLAGSRPGDVVLDCFNGSGTTGVVACQYDRRYLGVELNPEYRAMAEKRLDAATRQQAFPLFAGGAA